MAMSRQERGLRRGRANKDSVKAPRALLDMRLVWKMGVADGAEEEAILAKLRPHQQTLYRILKDDPKGFQKTMAEDEVRLRKRVEEKKKAKAAGGGVVAGVSAPADRNHLRSEEAIAKLVGDWESENPGKKP